MTWVDLQRDQPPVRRQGAGQPDGRIAAEGADLQDSPRPDHLREEMEHLALRRRDVDRRQARRLISGEDRTQRRILPKQLVGDIIVDLRPIGHAFYSSPL
jgi:hypothetical protein